MTDQPNPYAPFKPPFRIGNDGNIYDTQNWPLKGLWDSSIGQRIVDLLNRDADQAKQPSPDLEPVWRLIEWIAKLPETDAWDGKRINVQYLCSPSFFRKALPVLKSLLAEVERLREENVKLKKETAAAAWWQRRD